MTSEIGVNNANINNRLLCIAIKFAGYARGQNDTEKAKLGNIHCESKTTYHIPCGG